MIMASTTADHKPFLGLGFSIFFLILISTSVAADPSLEEHKALHSPSELEQLKSKISFLESKIRERDYELRKKDQIIREKSNYAVTLENEIACLRKNRPSDCKEHTNKENTHTRTDDFEKQVCGSFHSWFAVYLCHLQTFWNESGRPVANKAYRELLERKAQVQQWFKILVEIILTEWIPNSIEQFLVFTTYLKPHVRGFATKTIDMFYKVMNYATALALQFFQEWIPNLIEQFLVFTTYLKPHVRCFATKTVDIFFKVENYAMPQALQFFQETKVFTKPYIYQMVTVAKLRLENAQLALQSYQKNVAGAYQKIINFAVSYYHQVHGGWHSRWFADCLSHLQSLWNEYGGPVANKAYQKLLTSKAQVWQWLGIHP